MLGKNERKENVAGAFRVDRKSLELVKGKNIVLVDDVITTGATMSACAEELLDSGGAQGVYALSVAVAR
jgi:predicted amidophosphoribosyltransferase